MKTVLIYSGGLDSTCLLYALLREAKFIGGDVKAIGFDYGQRHKKELLAAQKIAALAEVEYRVIDLSSITPLLSGSSQTDSKVAVPEGRYDERSMKLTVVPNRNLIMLSIAAAWAISMKADRVAYAAHAGDMAVYPDCRPAFVNAANAVFGLCDWHGVRLYAPFVNLSKGGCLKAGVEAKAPFELTWSCYKGLDKHCGKCGACTERREAFQEAGVKDPTIYEEKKENHVHN